MVARNSLPNNLVRLLPASSRDISQSAEFQSAAFQSEVLGSATVYDRSTSAGVSTAFRAGSGTSDGTAPVSAEINSQMGHLLYLLACQVEWERRNDPSAAWEVIAATRSQDQEVRAHALTLLERSQQMKRRAGEDSRTDLGDPGFSRTEVGMRAPYGLEIIESCMNCKVQREGFFCRFSPSVARAVDEVSHHTVMPAGAVLFVEGQSPRGVFILCSGVVKLSTTSKEGKVLILKQSKAGDVLGLSAAISGTNYEMTAETASACQLNFIGRQDVMKMLQRENEVGVHAALWLCREFQGAYRDIHDLILARSSSGKLARLLLSCVPATARESEELYLRGVMTHEEMAQRIGSSRETVTRLLSELKKKRLIRHEGATLVIRNKSGLEALAQ